MYNFKNIAVVPPAKSFVDIMLSKTQRKTPTIVHKNYNISRIRKFYMRKVTFTKSNFHDRLSLIIQQFPKLEDIHPFYADLMNVLYDRDHYKIGLAGLSLARKLVDDVGKCYVKLLKFGDSLYRCKQLKKAALGRMASIIKKQSSNLEYLEQVRQHLARLPSIDPYARTILLCGFPNVGKSSFMNKITRADVEVQDYAFTTKALHIGHMDYKYLRWQVIDTPGILDHPLEERNVIEMQAVTALVHLQAAVVYFMDLSETCGYGIEDQVKLLKSLTALFHKKPMTVVFNKCDLKRSVDLLDVKRDLIKELQVEIMEMSTVTEEGVSEVKLHVCESLLKYHLDCKLKAYKGLAEKEIYVAMPVPRDAKQRPACIVKRKACKRKLERDIEMEEGDDYVLDLKKHYDLAPEWKYDTIPEMWEGHNIADYIDKNIEGKLSNVLNEEYNAAEAYQPLQERDEKMTLIRDLAKVIREKKKVLKQEGRLKKKTIRSRTAPSECRNRTVKELTTQLGQLGINIESTADKHFSRSVVVRHQSKSLTHLKVTPQSLVPQHINSTRHCLGIKDDVMNAKLTKLSLKAICKVVRKKALKGEADRFIGNKMPKHLYSGKTKHKSERR